MKLNDLTGRRFTRLLVLDRAENSKSGQPRWKCVCDCGKEKIVLGSCLVKGSTQSCRCLNAELTSVSNSTHGCCRLRGVTREYKAWKKAKERCFNPNNRQYRDYGARGITMCDAWKNDFAVFLKDMGACPSGLTIDRVLVNGDYQPGNCRWATDKQQARNRRSNLNVVINGVSRCLIEWSEISGVPYHTVYHRLTKLGWDPEMAIFSPVRYKKAA